LRGAQGDLKVGGQLRFYRGFGDDPVDPLIAADKGAIAPAFRDFAYVVFENLELGDFGNRIPALSFEIFAHGGDASVSLQQLVPGALTGSVSTIDPLRGFADEGGGLASTLAAIDQVIPLVCTSGKERLRIWPRTNSANALRTLPTQLLPDRHGREGERQMQRAGIVAREPTALRYYDEDRDYQPGVQRALGSRGAGHETMIELPATMTASGARQLVNDRANRGRWQRETILWRIGQLDPTLQPGEIVRVPGLQGLWFVQRWEWFDRGIELVLERLPPNVLAAPPSDPGSANPPFDEVIPPHHSCGIRGPGRCQRGDHDADHVCRRFGTEQGVAWRGALPRARKHAGSPWHLGNGPGHHRCSCRAASGIICTALRAGQQHAGRSCRGRSRPHRQRP
jgi:hypothetical protein